MNFHWNSFVHKDFELIKFNVFTKQRESFEMWNT